MATKQTYTEDSKKTTTKTTSTKEQNKQAIQNINRTGTVSGKSSGVSNISGKIVKDTTNASNLSGNNRQQALGTPKITSTSSSLGKPSVQESGKTFVPDTRYTTPSVKTNFNSAISRLQQNIADKKERDKTASKYSLYDDRYSEQTNALRNNYLDSVNRLYEESQDPKYMELTSDPLYKDYMSDKDAKYLEQKNNEMMQRSYQTSIAKGDYGTSKEIEDKSKGGTIKDEDVFERRDDGNLYFVDFAKDKKALTDDVTRLRKLVGENPSDESLAQQLAQAEKKLSDLLDKEDYQEARYRSLVYEDAKLNRTPEEASRIARMQGSYGNTILEDIGLGLTASKVKRLGGLISMYESLDNDIDYSQIEEYQEAIDIKNQIYELAEDPKYNLLMEEGYENLSDEDRAYVDSINKQIKDMSKLSKELTKEADRKYANMDKMELGTQLNEIANELSFMQQNGEDQTKRLVVNTIVNVVDNLALQGTGIAIAGEAGMKAGTAIMSASAFGDTYARDLENGYSPRQALGHSSLMFGIEYSSELIGGERMVKLFESSEVLPSTFTEFIWENIKSGGAETAEEGFNWVVTPIMDAVYNKMVMGDVGSIEGWDVNELKESLSVAFCAGMLQGSIVQARGVFDAYSTISSYSGKANLQDALEELLKMQQMASNDIIVLEDGTVTSEAEILSIFQESIINGINEYYAGSIVGDAVQENQPNNFENYVEELTPKADEVTTVERDNYISSLENEAVNVEEKIKNVDIAAERTDIADTIDNKIRNAMPASEAKRMVEKAFNLGVRNWYDVRNVEEFVEQEGVERAAEYLGEIIENSPGGDLYFEYIAPNEDLLNGEFSISEVIEKYFNNELINDNGGRKPITDMEFRQGNPLEDTFFSPQNIEDGKKVWDTANQRINNSNRNDVAKARAEAVVFAHTKDAADVIGLSQAEINKKVKQWSNYSSKAREISNRLNNGVPREYQWVGLENSNLLSRYNITEEQIKSMVKDVTGFTSKYDLNQIADAMLAFDGSINYEELIINFLDREGAMNLIKERHALGTYDHNSTTIDIGNAGNGTVYHELGHFIDNLWGREITGNDAYLTDLVFGTSAGINKVTDPDVKQFVENFKTFAKNLADKSDIRSDYTQSKKEIFARFSDYFVHWVDKTAGGWATYESQYKDNFNVSDCYDFVKLIQQKNMLNATVLNQDLAENETEQMDAEYFAAIENGDMETVQRLVDEAAKRAGNDIKAFHSTNAEFTKFSKEKQGTNFNNYLHFGSGFYFGPTIEETKRYGKNTMSVYLSADRLLDVGKPVENEKAYQYLIDNGYHPADAKFAMNYGDRFINALYDTLLDKYSQGGANVQVQNLLVLL